jgi:hypothetical protein
MPAQVIKAPLVWPGDSVRVVVKRAASLQPTLRLLSGEDRSHAGRVTAASGDSLTVLINARIAQVAGIGIGHNETDYTVAYDELERLQVFKGLRIRRPKPLRIAASVVVATGAAVLLAQPGGTCGDHPCTPSNRRTNASVGFVVFGLATAFWPVSRWTTVELPGR